MRSSQLPSAEADIDPGAMALMRRRFAEALRRAEIIGLVNAAADPDELARTVVEELCEAYDAEIALVAGRDAEDPGWQPLAALGVDPERAAAAARSPLAGQAADAEDTEDAIVALDDDLLGVGGRAAMVVSRSTGSGREVLLAVVRLYDEAFDEAEAALFEATATGVAHALDRLWGHVERDELIDRLRQTLMGTAEALANALEAKDDYTAGHARQIAELSELVGGRIGLSPAELDELRFGAIFHDIGKIAVPDEVLHKPSPLTAAEEEIMHAHVTAGERILDPVPGLDGVGSLVRHSHERWDGRGYPDGLAADAIPLGARIIAVADAWHAMTSTRPYRVAMSHAEASAELQACAGRQFDPELVTVFLAALDERRAQP